MENAEHYNDLGKAELAKPDHAACALACEHFERAASLDPKSAVYPMHAGVACQLAVTRWLSHIGSGPLVSIAVFNPSTRFGRAIDRDHSVLETVSEENRDWLVDMANKAVIWYGRALTIDPAHHTARSWLVQSLRNIGAMELAIQQVDLLLAEAASDPDAVGVARGVKEYILSSTSELRKYLTPEEARRLPMPQGVEWPESFGARGDSKKTECATPEAGTPARDFECTGISCKPRQAASSADQVTVAASSPPKPSPAAQPSEESHALSPAETSMENQHPCGSEGKQLQNKTFSPRGITDEERTRIMSFERPDSRWGCFLVTLCYAVCVLVTVALIPMKALVGKHISYFVILVFLALLQAYGWIRTWKDNAKYNAMNNTKKMLDLAEGAVDEVSGVVSELGLMVDGDTVAVRFNDLGQKLLDQIPMGCRVKCRVSRHGRFLLSVEQEPMSSLATKPDPSPSEKEEKITVAACSKRTSEINDEHVRFEMMPKPTVYQTENAWPCPEVTIPTPAEQAALKLYEHHLESVLVRANLSTELLERLGDAVGRLRDFKKGLKFCNLKDPQGKRLDLTGLEGLGLMEVHSFTQGILANLIADKMIVNAAEEEDRYKALTQERWDCLKSTIGRRIADDTRHTAGGFNLSEGIIRILSASIFGDAVSTRYEINEARAKAEAGDPESQNRLAAFFFEGKQVARNSAEAARWSQKAAEHGCPEAQFILGLLYDGGDGVPQDSKLALSWYRKAASQGHRRAIKMVGDMSADETPHEGRNLR